jgi:hypothetical protein
MGDLHFREVCIEHGLVVRQCRCPSPSKTVRSVPCPIPDVHESLGALATHEEQPDG